MQKGFSDQLGLEYEEIRPNLVIKNKNNNFTKPYVCIAVQSTAQYKYWNNKNGWQVVCDYLISKGYDVVCIDKEKEFGFNDFVNKQPVGVIDKSGDIDLQDRITDIYNCEFFIGLGSGLSWINWALGKHTYMINGFAKLGHEFTSNTTRIYNDNTCVFCWNDEVFTFDPSDWDWCPVYKGTKKQHICQRSITPLQVFQQLITKI